MSAEREKLDGEQIIKGVIAFLNGQLDGSIGYVGQRPYRDDLFKMFAAAYQGGYFEAGAKPYLTADSLSDLITARCDGDDQARSAKRTALMQPLLLMWHEWRFAWDQYPRYHA